MFSTNVVTFTWSAVVDPLGGITGYQVLIGTTPGGSDVFNGTISGTSLTVTNSFGVHLYATVTAVNNAGIESAASAGNPGIALVNPAWMPVASMTAPSLLNWSSVSGKVYQVWSTTNLSVPFTAFGGLSRRPRRRSRHQQPDQCGPILQNPVVSLTYRMNMR